MEELEVRDNHVDGAVREGAGILYKVKEIPHVLPGSLSGRNGNRVKVIKIRPDISGVGTDGVIGKSLSVKHLNKGRKIIHGEVLQKIDSSPKQNRKKQEEKKKRDC